MNWRDGYLRQAESDYRIYSDLNQRRAPLCHRLHYLQMASEKLAKSFLCHKRHKPYRKTHYALARFLKSTKRHPAIPRLLGYGNYHLAYAAYIDSLLNVAERFENLAPVGGNYDKLNPEYPWQDGFGKIQVPVDYPFTEFAVTDFAKMQNLITSLLRIAKQM
jgi:hypothetical protein